MKIKDIGKNVAVSENDTWKFGRQLDCTSRSHANMLLLALHCIDTIR